jgi:hypothetical protein
LAIANLPVFLGFQADVLFRLPSPRCRRFKVFCLILSSSAFRAIASVTFSLRVPLDIPLSHAFGYADPIVHFSRVRRATLHPPSGSRFSCRWPLWANPSFNRTCAKSRAGRLIQTLGHSCHVLLCQSFRSSPNASACNARAYWLAGNRA